MSKRILKRQSISATIAIMTFLGGTLFAFIIAGTAYKINRHEDIEELRKRSEQMADRLAFMAELLLDKEDTASVQRIIENSAVEERVEFIAIVNNHLDVLASTQNNLLKSSNSQYPENPHLFDEFRKTFKEQKKQIIFQPEKDLFEVIVPFPLSATPNMNFAIAVAFQNSYIAVESKELFWSYLELSLILTAFAMAILYWILRKVVTRPLRQLIQASARLGGGELGLQVPETSSYEIGKLSGTFNQMSLSLASQQNALKTSEERYLQIFHFFPLPLILMDNRGQMIKANSAYFSQANKNPFYLKEWEGKSVLDLPLIQKGKIQSEIHQLLEQGDSFKLSKIFIALNETLSPGIFNISGIPLFDTPARLNAAILAIEDITLQQNLENQLIQSQKMESLEILSGGIAHDFNNILTGILGYSQLLREQLPPDDFNQKALKAIEKSSLRARDLIQQMIGFARWHPLAKSKVEVNTLVAGIVALVQKTLDREIQIQAVLVKESCFILVDADQLHQALLNLCINARDAIQTGGGKILLKTERKTIEEGHFGESGEKEFVDIIVQDNGIGMEPDVLAHIFEPFYTTKEVGKGSGLGLSVTYGIVKANGGEINVQSEPGKETTFTLRFPLID